MDYREIFRHCIDVWEDDGEYVPVRFSREKVAEQRVSNPERPYFLCPVGVTMEFSTDSPRIAFSYRNTSVYYGSQTYDFYENGVFCGSVAGRWGSTGGRIEYTLKNSGRTDLQIWLPIGVDPCYSAFELGDWSPAPVGGGRRLLVLGDSIAQGLFGVSPSLSFVPLLGRRYGLDVLNLSVGGEIFRAGQVEEPLPFAPDLILVEMGTNDAVFVKDIAVIRKNIAAFFDDVTTRFAGVPVTVLTPFWQWQFVDLPAEQAQAWRTLVGQITAAVFEQAEKHGCRAVDGLDVLPHDRSLYYDGAHPNDAGFAALADNLAARLDW